MFALAVHLVAFNYEIEFYSVDLSEPLESPVFVLSS